jgi:hypothetical protein
LVVALVLIVQLACRLVLLPFYREAIYIQKKGPVITGPFLIYLLEQVCNPGR